MQKLKPRAWVRTFEAVLHGISEISMKEKFLILTGLRYTTSGLNQKFCVGLSLSMNMTEFFAETQTACERSNVRGGFAQNGS